MFNLVYCFTPVTLELLLANLARQDATSFSSEVVQLHFGEPQAAKSLPAIPALVCLVFADAVI